MNRQVSSMAGQVITVHAALAKSVQISLASIIVILVVSLGRPLARGASFQGLGDLPGGTFSSSAAAISANGRVVVGSISSSSGTQGFRWTAEDGMVGLGDLAGGNFSSSASAVSGDGSVIVGTSHSTSGTEAFRWTKASGMLPLGSLAGGSFYSRANAVSGDGEVVVGESHSLLSGTRREAFRWTRAEGMIGLGDLPGGNYDSIAYAVSADGSTIVGYSSSSNATWASSEAFRWTQATGMIGLGDFAGGYFNSIAYAISADGLVIVGRGYSGAFADSTHEAFRWTAATELVRLGFIPCHDWSVGRAVSADGSVIVGDPETSPANCAFIWDAQHGMRSLHEVLTQDHGLNLAGWQLSTARGISADGQVIVGTGTSPAGQTEAWIANLRPPLLAIRCEAGKVVLSWTNDAPGFVLEQTASLSPTNTWSVVSSPSPVLGSPCVVTYDTTQKASFFRLQQP